MQTNPLNKPPARTANHKFFSTTDAPKYPHVYVNLQGVRAHSLSIVALTTRALAAAGVGKAMRNNYATEALSGNIDHCVTTTMKWVSWQEFLEEDFCRFVTEDAGGMVDDNYWIDGKRRDRPGLEFED